MTTPNRYRTATMHPNGSRTTRDSQAALRSTCNLDNPFFSLPGILSIPKQDTNSVPADGRRRLK